MPTRARDKKKYTFGPIRMTHFDVYIV